MVRTKKGPMKRPEGATSAHVSRGKYICHNRILKDHTGKPALMSWGSCEANGPLPPLASWIYYMVHPDVSHDFDGCALHDGLTMPSSVGRGGIFRYEFFFLPGATAEECHAHFLGEMKARGTIWRQIRKVKKAIEPEKQESGHQEEEEEDSECRVNAFIGQKEYDWVHDPSSDEDYANCPLPGLVWPMDDRDCNRVYYRGWFFMYHDADTDCTRGKAETRAISLVRFDPIPLEWDEEQDGVKKWDPMDHPICSEPIPVVNVGSDYSVGSWQDIRTRKFWEEEANEATNRAWDLGWKTW
ncbi:uncharacterized protein B0J16DRAFT_147532 [Fusarium flagelliforme]|uniref:uncharacterized protein n=1 Tax=Fusarium flagelliforme TaxID=2675880 RepID=UPI001E8DB905|nr:uncharacterized protein B0J16DRAFT_147532 [Fusarium flagelliforme]KAH7182294.1 hypothetical protein B0J16DRAFT_147532 [Fusarium flagelliforme]